MYLFYVYSTLTYGVLYYVTYVKLLTILLDFVLCMIYYKTLIGDETQKKQVLSSPCQIVYNCVP
jgi:hypothetical protein